MLLANAKRVENLMDYYYSKKHVFVYVGRQYFA